MVMAPTPPGSVHQLDPAATLYIDDLPANIATGRTFGFRSFQYDLHDHPAFERWLAEQLPTFKPEAISPG